MQLNWLSVVRAPAGSVAHLHMLVENVVATIYTVISLSSLSLSALNFLGLEICKN
jgi:hypothetical protein